MPGLPIVTVPHPVTHLNKEEAERLGESALDEIIHVLSSSAGQLAEEYRKRDVSPRQIFQARPLFTAGKGEKEKVAVPDSLEAISNLFYARGWTDGLPIVPPTEERVARMLQHTDRDPEEVVALVPPRWGKATVKKIATNAVMAGCLPSYLPVILTATEAMSEESFNLFGVQATTNPAAPLMVVNGPIAKELEINSGYNVFGQGWRSNATMGRAIRLILTNIGGGTPGVGDRSTLGQPGKYSYCIAENEGQSPWDPLHVEKGFPKDSSTVTMVGAAGPHNIISSGSSRAEEVLSTIAGAMTAAGNNNLFMGTEAFLVLSPEHAGLMANAGFSKAEIRKFIFDRARVPAEKFSEGNMEIIRKWRPEAVIEEGGKTWVLVAEKPENICIVVAGGAGAHSLFTPIFISKIVMQVITHKDGTPARSIKDFKPRRIIGKGGKGQTKE
ncbi:MAG: hypothetical protein HY882_06425 [Deltaproteobacteria bacterium]|nr:hypothetical protein [Deltaproteobacteria bacterium]